MEITVYLSGEIHTGWRNEIINKSNELNLPIEWKSEIFVPYNYGYFAFVYNNKKLKNPPKSMDELLNITDARIVIQDPRTSTPGLGLLTWMKILYGDNAQENWRSRYCFKLFNFTCCSCNV